MDQADFSGRMSFLSSNLTENNSLNPEGLGANT